MSFFKLLRSQIFKNYITNISRNCSSTATNKPVKFTSSNAASWKAEFSRKGIQNVDESAWFQPYVVCASLAIFLYYFCVYREENDLDEKIGRSLYDQIDGLEEAQLKASLAYNLENGRETSGIKRRLQEIQNAKLTEAKTT